MQNVFRLQNYTYELSVSLNYSNMSFIQYLKIDKLHFQYVHNGMILFQLIPCILHLKLFCMVEHINTQKYIVYNKNMLQIAFWEIKSL